VILPLSINSQFNCLHLKIIFMPYFGVTPSDLLHKVILCLKNDKYLQLNGLSLMLRFSFINFQLLKYPFFHEKVFIIGGMFSPSAFSC
jgi:hypothetical protein